VVVSRDLARMIRADDIAPTLQAALDAWADVAPRLEERARRLDEGEKSELFDPRGAHSPLPRAYQWCDGSVYEAHMLRMSKWIKKPVDPRFFEEPWMYDVPGRIRRLSGADRRHSRSIRRVGHRL
jgi:fumarylacetoacetate (FAA) hydrolase